MNNQPTNTPGLEARAAQPMEVEARHYGWKLAGLFLLIAALLGVLGWAYLARERADARATAQRELSAIADLKLKQLSNWRQERLSDARLFARARFVAQDVQRLLAEPDSEPARAAVFQWLDLLKTEERYDAAIVFDMQLEPRLAIPPAAREPAALVRGLLAQALQTHDVVFSDLHRQEPNGPVELDLVLPINEEAEVRRGAPIAAVLLKLDAQRFLFPLLQSWPTPSQTAETLLVRHEGKEVLYLNELRHRAGSALTLRLPSTLPHLPVARILRGETGVLEGVDYRGVPVVAVGRAVPGTPWAMVAKVDREEIYAPLRGQTLSALAVLGALLMAGALLVAWLWRRHSARFLERELAERKAHQRERDRMNRLYAALSQVNEAVVRARSRDELLQAMCRVLVRFGGVQMAWVGWMDPATQRVVPLAQFGDEAAYLQAIQVFADERPQGHGPVGTAIREGHPCVCEDISTEPTMVPWREAAARSGWCALAAFPIRQEGWIRGALAVYASQSDFFGPQERALIEEAADDVSFGLDVLLNAQRRQEAEDQLAQANADLERKVQERTAQLVEANANLQAFAHSAAHDLRSPLRSIGSFSSLVLELGGPGLDGQGRSMLERITASASQMGQLLDDLLEYSKMNQAQIRLEPVDLKQAVREALALLDGDIHGKQALVSVAEPLPEVIGHLATLVVLINNLVSNALKFVPAGVQPQIRIRAEAGEVERQSVGASERQAPEPEQALRSTLHAPTVRLWVEDNGIGIAPEDLEKVFGAFERLHGKGAYPGTGLGLAIVRKGAERMGGQVGVLSAVGKGSRFWVQLQATSSSARG